MRFWRGRLVGFAPVACCVAIAAIWLGAAPARGATTVYPAGAGTFSGGAQGWEVTSATCNVALLCTASGGYDGGGGNPPGSLTASTSIVANPVSLFKTTVTMRSPDFKVGAAGTTTMHLEREFAPGSLLDLLPELKYSAKLIDMTAGTESTPISETLKGASGWGAVDAASSVKAGHTYAISLSAETGSTLVQIGLLSGSSSVRFDDVSLSVQTSPTAEEGGGGAAGDPRLASLIQSSLIGPAILKGRRLFVRARCPAKIGLPCRIAVQGLLGKFRPATTRRTSRVGKGRTKRMALKVKPRARGKLDSRRRLLFRETVRAGGATATVYRRLKLIHEG